MPDSSDDLRLAVLRALIEQHGPLRCVHVARVHTRLPLQPGEGPNALGQYRQETRTTYRCEASELRVRDGAVVLELAEPPTDKLPEPTEFPSKVKAAQQRDRLCEVLLRLPWDRTPLGRPLTPDDARAALSRVQALSGGWKIFPTSTPEISAVTFEKTNENTSR